MPVTTEDVAMEIAEAEAAGISAVHIDELRGSVEGISAIAGMGMSYDIPDADKAAWMPAWRLEIGMDKQEYGTPTRLPRDRLGYYLGKKRPIDGGKLFSLRMPERLEGERQFQCFIVPNLCGSKFDTKTNLCDHMEGAHPRESQGFKEEIEIIRGSAKAENTALKSIMDSITNTPDPGVVVVPEETRAEYDKVLEDVVISPGEEVVLTVIRPECSLCDWPNNVEKYANTPPTKEALRAHIIVKHKDDV